MEVLFSKRFYGGGGIEMKGNEISWKLIADEDVPRPIIEKLRSRGLDVLSVDEELKGQRDPDIIAAATKTGRVLVTFDDDFKDLAQDTSEHPGVLYITKRTDYDIIVETLCKEYIDQLSKEDLENTVVHVSP